MKRRAERPYFDRGNAECSADRSHTDVQQLGSRRLHNVALGFRILVAAAQKAAQKA
jgi:hypothetical protein